MHLVLFTEWGPVLLVCMQFEGRNRSERRFAGLVDSTVAVVVYDIACKISVEFAGYVK